MTDLHNNFIMDFPDCRNFNLVFKDLDKEKENTFEVNAARMELPNANG